VAAAQQEAKQPATLGDVLYAGQSKNVPSETDWVALVRRVAAGDQLALHGLYERTHRVVFTLSMRITGKRETAEELTLDVFHDVWRRASHYGPGERHGARLDHEPGALTGNRPGALREPQEARRSRSGRAGACHRARQRPRYAGVQEQCQALRTALSVLTSAERQAIEAAFFSEMTPAEVAALFKEPLGTVKTRIRSGLLKLRQALTAGANA
jgi:RNA polymerase sigma-70 factor (ECF subfamily)